MNDLQKITDQLARSLNRAVFVEDASFHPLATSAQIGLIDDARVQALLDRGPTQQHLRYFVDCGVTRVREPLRIPATTQQGLLPRLMIPVTAAAEVLARIWLIDAGPPLDDEDVVRAIEACDEMRPHLLGRRETTRRSIAAGGELLRDIQHAGKNRRQELFAKLGDSCEIGDLERAYVCVVSFLASSFGHSGAVAESDEPTLREGVLDTFIELLDVRGAVGYVRDSDLIVLVSPHGTGRITPAPISAAARQTATLHGLSVNAIGIGGAL